ncbi:putative MFS-type transporter C09D4.1, partial [Asbolus verrucosus]
MEVQRKDEGNLNLLEYKQASQNGVEIKAYKRRWIVLFIYVFYTTINAYQWIEYSVITNIVMRYYNVSAVTVDWTSTIYMALYAPLVFPASYILDKKGLRVAGLIGALGTALGTAIKVFSIDRDSFWIVLTGQGIVSASQLLILCLPPRVAAVWFKPNEVSTACSLGVFGTQLGLALGFVLPPIIVKNHENAEDIGPDLKVLCWGLTAFIIPGALAVIFYFPLRPPKPPSITQYEERSKQEKFSTKAFLDSVKVILTNKAFMIHVIAYGINIGVFSAVGPLLNQVVLQYFPNCEEDVGRMGLSMIVVGMIGSISFGFFLDKTHKYKLFTNAYMPVGFEMAMELTYPSSEGTTTGLLMAPSQIMGTIFILMMGKINALIGPFWALGSQAALLVIGTIITWFVPNKLKRQEAFKHRSNEEWFEYSIITNIIMKYYNVSAVAVDWTSIIYMALYMPMVIPASYLMEKKGLRKTALIGVLGTTLGTTIKIFSLAPDRMWVTYLGQTILSSMQVFILALPPRIAAVWFGPKEVSLACALGVFGTQLGQAIGFVLPPIVVKNHEAVEDIESDMRKLIWGLASFALFVTLALLCNKGFDFHAVAYGINIAVFVSVSTLLNQFVLSYFPNSEEDAGRLGLAMVILGMTGSVIFGFILDKTHKYKETTLALYIFSLVAVAAFMYALESGSKSLVYASGAMVGFFTNTYMPVGLELGIEITYPEAESTSSGILISMTQTFGVIFTLLLGWLFSTVGCFWSLASMVAFLFLGAILTALIPNVMKRQNANKR